MNNIDLSGRVAVVTGGAKGIGRAIVERFLVSGARVFVWDLQRGDLPEQVGFCEVDVTDIDAVDAAADKSRVEAGRIDILVNNAGIIGPTVPLIEYPVDQWRRVIEIDLIGQYLCTRAVVPGMVAQGYGRVVSIASLAGKEGTPNASAYVAAKGGLIAMTKSLGKELARTGVIVTCIAPAGVETELIDEMTEEHARTMLAKSPMKRFGRPEEAAALVAWLASDEISFSTGSVYDLSGGRTSY